MLANTTWTTHYDNIDFDQTNVDQMNLEINTSTKNSLDNRDNRDNCDNYDDNEKKVKSEKVDPMENQSVNLFDDIYYHAYRETNIFIKKEYLLQTLLNDLYEFLKTVMTTENNLIYVGYIIYSKLQLNSSKMNKLLNLLIQKTNPTIRVQSLWIVESTYNGPIETGGNIEIVDMDKIKIKLIIRPMDKDFIIKKYATESLAHMMKKKKNKKNVVDDYVKLFNV